LPSHALSLPTGQPHRALRTTALSALAALSLSSLQLAAPTAAAAATTHEVTVFAGGGVLDRLPATQASLLPDSAAYAPDGTLYIADRAHNRIRAVAADGTISTVAGDSRLVDGAGGYTGDNGPASAAELGTPISLHTDAAGDLFFIDSPHYRVRRIDHATHVITTIAGNGTAGSTGNMAAASADATSQPLVPGALAVNPVNGDVAIYDVASHAVWAVAADGSLRLLAGGGADAETDGADAASVSIPGQTALAYTSTGDLLFTDYYRGQVWRVRDNLLNLILGYGSASPTDRALATDVRVPAAGSLVVGAGDTIYVGSDYLVNYHQTPPYAFTIGGAISTVTGAPCDDVTGLTPTGGLVLTCSSVYAPNGPGSWTNVAGPSGFPMYANSTPDGTEATSASISPRGAIQQIGTGTSTDTYAALSDGLLRISSDNKTHLLTALKDVTSLTPAGANASDGVYATRSGSLYHVTPDGTATQYTTLTNVFHVAADPSGNLYYDNGQALGVIDAATHRPRTLVPDITELNGMFGNPCCAATEGVTSLAVAPDGSLLVLTDESHYHPTPVSRVRKIDPATGDSTLLYYGPRLQALTVTPAGQIYVATTVAVAGVSRSEVAQLGSDGALTRVAGAGSIVDSTTTLNEWGPVIVGLGVASDGTLVVTDPDRIYDVTGLPTASPLPSISDVHVTYAPEQGNASYETNTLSWTVPTGLPTGTKLYVSIRSGSGTAPAALTPAEGGLTLEPSATTQDFHYVTPGAGTVYTFRLVAPNGDVSAPTSLATVAPGDTTPPVYASSLNELYSADTTATIALYRYYASSDADVDSIDIRLIPGTTAPASSVTPVSTGLALHRTLRGLTVGSTYTMTITTRDYSGNSVSAPSPYTFTAGAEPGLTLMHGPAESGWTAGSPTFDFYSATAVPASGMICALDGKTLPYPNLCNSGGFTITGLAAGSHTLTAYRTTSFGNGPVFTRHWRVDLAAPAVTPAALPTYTLGKATFSWTGTDAGSGVANYDVRYRKAAWNGTFGNYTTPAAGTATKARSLTLATGAGYTYCFSVRAHDAVGNISGWTIDRCTAVPLDDRALSASSGWTRATGSAYYASTVTVTASAGRTLTRSSVQARRLALVATTCSTCGSLGVYWNGHLVKTLSLVSSTTRYRQVLPVTTFSSVGSGTIVVKSLSSKKVYLDGLGISRT
jgi:hypothetical protein